MTLLSIFAYISSFVILLLSINFIGADYKDFYSYISIHYFFIGFLLSLINFSISEILEAIKSSIFNTQKELNNLIFYRKVIKVLWNYVLFSCIVLGILEIFLFLGEVERISIYTVNKPLILLPFGLIILKVFIFMPLEISLNKKIILAKNN